MTLSKMKWRGDAAESIVVVANSRARRRQIDRDTGGEKQRCTADERVTFRAKKRTPGWFGLAAPFRVSCSPAPVSRGGIVVSLCGRFQGTVLLSSKNGVCDLKYKIFSDWPCGRLRGDTAIEQNTPAHLWRSVYGRAASSSVERMIECLAVWKN